jgi:hypothetical protein
MWALYKKQIILTIIGVVVSYSLFLMLVHTGVIPANKYQW